jgi:hypothetical protein
MGDIGDIITLDKIEITGGNDIKGYLQIGTLNVEDEINARTTMSLALRAPEGTFEEVVFEDYGSITGPATLFDDYGDLGAL